MKKNVVLAFIAAITVMLLSTVFLDSDLVFAHGSIDQSFLTPVDGGSHTIFPFLPVGQEFTPSQSTLVGVDIDISSANPQFGPDALTVNIRKETIDSPILATASQSVAEDFSGLLHFDLPAPLGVTPGDKYVLEVQATKPTHGWKNSGDGYPGGEAILSGNVWSGNDWGFQTYSPGVTAVCVLDLTLSYAGDTLTMDFDLGTPEPAVWNVWLIVNTQFVPLWRIPLPVIDPPISPSLSIPGFPSVGKVGFLTALTTSEGIACSDWEVVDTGLPASGGASAEELRELFPKSTTVFPNN